MISPRRRVQPSHHLCHGGGVVGVSRLPSSQPGFATQAIAVTTSRGRLRNEICGFQCGGPGGVMLASCSTAVVIRRQVSARS